MDDSPFLSALMNSCSMVLHRDVSAEVRPLFFNVSLVNIHKKMGGVQPIAVRCMLRCLVVKFTRRFVTDEMSTLLGTKQLGFGV